VWKKIRGYYIKKFNEVTENALFTEDALFTGTTTRCVTDTFGVFLFSFVISFGL
jgi:hypothetical protein